jgi:hypothetical protein
MRPRFIRRGERLPLEQLHHQIGSAVFRALSLDTRAIRDERRARWRWLRSRNARRSPARRRLRRKTFTAKLPSPEHGSFVDHRETAEASTRVKRQR